MGDASSDLKEVPSSTGTSTEPTNLKPLNGSHTKTGAVPHYDYPEPTPEGPYKVIDQYHSKPRKLRVACVGAGATGLCLAYKMERMLEPGSFELTLFEKNSHYGGTWYENTYPGVACDIPSHIYTFTFDPNPNWSHYFAPGDEIQRYFEDFADRHGSKQYMKLNTRVEEIKWNNDEAVWHIKLKDTKTGEIREDWAHSVVNGTGILNTWKWPEVEGLQDFEGPLMHSAAWNHDVEFDGKVAGVIGTGSTSVQIVPQLQKICKEVQVYMRSPTWISAPFGANTLTNDLKKGEEGDVGNRQYKFTEEDKKRFREDPEYHLFFRKKIEAEINGLFGMFRQGSELSNVFRDAITKEMHRRMGPGHEDLKKFIIPTWAPGCRRISPADGYLEALVQPNVNKVFGGIKKVTKNGIITEDGVEHHMDILVCATGFKVAFKPGFKVINGEGLSIQDDWGESVNLYFGVSAPRFPNYYTIVGPGATWSSGTLLPSIETSVEYSVKCMKKMQHETIKSLAVKQEALDDIYGHFDEFHKTTVWQEDCRSWFKDGKIKNRIYLWPGSTIHFLKTIKDPRFEDYDIKYRFGNRFAYLGNGDVKATGGDDVRRLSTYIRANDHDWSVE